MTQTACVKRADYNLTPDEHKTIWYINVFVVSLSLTGLPNSCVVDLLPYKQHQCERELTGSDFLRLHSRKVNTPYFLYFLGPERVWRPLCLHVCAERRGWFPIHPAVEEFGSRGLGCILRRGCCRGPYCLVDSNGHSPDSL